MTSKGEELKKSIKNEYEQIRKDLKAASFLADQIPKMEDRKKEVEAKITFVTNIPYGTLEDVASQILPFQIADEEKITHSSLAGLTANGDNVFLSPYNSSGSISAYEYVVSTSQQFIDQNVEWIEPIQIAFDNLADEKSKKAHIPEELSLIHPELGIMFTKVIENYDKAMNGVMSVNQVAMDMRDVIQQLWGGLVNLARQRNPEKLSRIQHFQHKTDNHRRLIANCFSQSEIDIIETHQIIKRLFDITKEISRSDFGKNPISTDLPKLKEIRRRWIILIDDLLGHIRLP